MTDAERPTAKVLFRVPNEDGSFEIETLWAYDLGEDRYKIDNIPFYAYSVSADDVVYALVDPDESRPTFQKVLTKSGNRTIRVIFDPPVEPGNRSDEVLQGLVAIGCGYEGAKSKYIAVNIPPVGLARPQYRLRVGEVRVFYDVSAESVEVLAIVPKSEAAIWLEQLGKSE